LETIYQSIETLSKEKGIDIQIVLDAVKDAMLIAARKHFRTEEDYVAELGEKTGAIRLFAVKKVVEQVTDPHKEITLDQAANINPEATVGSEVRIERPTDALGRIFAQTAKKVIFQKVREAEREIVYREYSGRVDELVNCTVNRVEGPDLILDLGRTEARLPKREQSKLDTFTVGDHVRCVIRLVDKSTKGPVLVVSRAAPELVMRLFEQEVPEVYDSTVVIKGCTREAGERTKIAVHTRDRDVDSVGACVGMKGMRVQSIIRELRGEKIDIIEFSEDPVVFAAQALSPAKISRVSIIDPIEKHMVVNVDDSQLALAIGRKGQNVRLAARLLGWKIDIKSEEEKRQEVESAMAALVVPGAAVSVLIDFGLGAELAGKLVESGVSTVEKLGSMTPEQLEEIPGIGEPLVEKIQLAVNNYYGQFETGENPQQGTAEPAAEPVQQTGLALEELKPEEPTAQSEGAEASQTAEMSAETLESEPNIEPAGGESDTIKDSRQGTEGRRPEEPSEEGKEG
jgi:N utilization substance protein A